MATLLDQIIDGSTDSTVRTSDLLRKVQVAARRVGAPEVEAWVKRELNGYGTHDELPTYRKMATIVNGLFTGPGHSRITQALPPHPEFIDDFTVHMRQPLVELETFANAEKDAQAEWPAWRVKSYENTGAYAIQFYALFSVWNVISRPALRGVVDTLRNKAMEFALDLQQEYPHAGEAGGPTVEMETRLATVVYNVNNNIYGNGTNIATGHDNVQKGRIEGQRDEFVREILKLGLSAELADEFVSAVDESGVEGAAARGFIERVKSGAIRFSGNASASVVGGALIELAKMYIGG